MIKRLWTRITLWLHNWPRLRNKKTWHFYVCRVTDLCWYATCHTVGDTIWVHSSKAEWINPYDLKLLMRAYPGELAVYTEDEYTRHFWPGPPEDNGLRHELGPS